MTDKDESQRKRKRFFKDELESSQDNIPPIITNLQNNESFLFSADITLHKDDAIVESELEPEVITEESERHDFMLKIKVVIPDISEKACNHLYNKFHNSNRPITMAMDYYFDFYNESTEPEEQPEIISETIHKPKHDSINSSHSEIIDLELDSDPPLPIGNSIHSQSLFINPDIEARKRKIKQYGERSPKKLKSEYTWKRFIGALQVNAMATRPTMRPLQYGSELKLNRSVSKNMSPTKMYNSHGKKKAAMANFVRITDLTFEREIGRVPEDVAQIIFPLMDDPCITFEVTLVYCGSKRLSVGDNFIVQLDCFLTSNMFENNSSSQKREGLSRGKSWENSKNAMVETEDELKNRSRIAAVISLFNKLRIKEVKDDTKKKLSSGITNSDDAEVIDVDNDEKFWEVMTDENGSYVNGDLDHNDNMNLNQLQNFYSIAQSSETIKKLPETEPSKDILKVDLRRYQKQGLTWMLRREREFTKAAQSQESSSQFDGSMMNPLWRQFKWPKDMSWASQKLSQSSQEAINDIYFYGNLHTGEFSVRKPMLTTMLKGGILSDEMGLGKTISTLALILSAPYDSEVVDKKLFNDEKEVTETQLFTQIRERPYASKTTLIIVPMSLLNQWHSEFEKTNNSQNMRAEVYYGGNVSNLKTLLTKTKNPPTVLITTYGIVQNEWTKIVKTKRETIDLDRTSGLFSLDFYRIVLDEGHTIRNRNTATSKSVMELSSKCKWVLTGTPIINRLDDMYSLVKFLHLEPWSQIGFWKQFVSIPFESKNFKQAFDVVNSILEPVFLRRTKQMKDIDGKPLVVLPSKEIFIERLKFNKYQDTIYKQLLNRAEDSVRSGLARGDLLKKYSTILVNILRLRQICCDAKLLGTQDENDEDLSNNNMFLHDTSDVNSLLKNAESINEIEGFKDDELEDIIKEIKEKHNLNSKELSLECSICTTEPIDTENVLFTECGHSFCKGCLSEYLYYQNEKKLEVKCPLCRHLISSNRLLTLETEESGAFNITHYNNNPRPAKIAALIRHLQQLQDSSPGEQIVVFSQFSSYLDILESELGNVFSPDTSKIYKFDGRLNLKDRSTILTDFQIKDPLRQKILLLSLKAGGVGLNLTCASYAFMMDPWWSPSMEDQAIDRIHRIGQTSNVKIVRFIMENSIEEKMLRIQERKRTIGEAMDADEDERRKRRIEEIKMLFE